MLSCDKFNAQVLTHNLVFHSRINHIEIDYHFIKDQVLQHCLDVQHVFFWRTLDDLFTKVLPTPRFISPRTKLLVFPTHQFEMSYCESCLPFLIMFTLTLDLLLQVAIDVLWYQPPCLYNTVNLIHQFLISSYELYFFNLGHLCETFQKCINLSAICLN